LVERTLFAITGREQANETSGTGGGVRKEEEIMRTMLSVLAAFTIVAALPLAAKAGGKSVQHSQPAQHSEITVTKNADKATPKLHVSTGKHIKTGLLHVH
jgi:hypothetical protein